MNHDHAKLATEELLHAIGEDVERDGLNETPTRVAKAWAHWTSGYGQDPQTILKSFDEQNYDEMVVVGNIPIYSHCEHHLAAIFGTATVAYIPNGRVVGLSKLARLVDIFARRLQVQERMTVQIADALYGKPDVLNDGGSRDFGTSPLQPRGVGVILRCRHMCIESRGTAKQGTVTTTSALRGVMATGEPRAEFLRLAGA